MKTEINIRDISIDDPEMIIENLKKGTDFQLVLYDGTDEYPAVGVWLEHRNKEMPCTIMFDFTKEEALFLGKSLIAISESI